MPWELNSDRPIYLQIVSELSHRIASGQIAAGERLPGVRELAADASVNPNTMQKALAELERSGLVYTQRTAGRFVTEDKDMIEQAKDELAAAEIKSFFANMGKIGYSIEKSVELINKVLEGESK